MVTSKTKYVFDKCDILSVYLECMGILSILLENLGSLTAQNKLLIIDIKNAFLYKFDFG